ncbi:TPA: hypothetical protein N0F65_001891 [Lagenidium giganteum]|uniref:Phosphodiesterase n=1 Tax=Lagenidium giganteum TaxID=4803 RepID=A0AAV2Z1R5_9STRA|nr:TPA: hypothetical protein N0F65_001891 [Lagenidium giganteum]
MSTELPTQSPPMQAAVHGTYQPKNQTLSRFFRRSSYGEKRSRAVAPAETMPIRRKKAGTDIIKARDGSVMAMRQHHRFRLYVGEFVGKLYVEVFLAIIILGYGIFVIVQLTMDPDDIKNIQSIVDVTDITVGSILMFEISLKLFAFGLVYLNNGWSIFDATVVVASFALGIVAATAKSQSATVVKVLRLRVLLRAFRVLVVFERLRQRTRALKFQHRGQITSPVEHVLRLLNELRYHPALKSSTRSDIEYAIDVVKNNRLYEANEELIAAEVDDITQNWLRGEVLRVKDNDRVLPEAEDENGNATSTGAGDPLTPRTASAAVIEKPGNEVTALGMKRGVTMKELLPQLDTAADFELQNLLRDSANWSFDIFRVHILTNGNALCHLGYHLLHDMASTSLNIEQNVLVGFLLEIQRGYVATNPYHNSIHAADVMQTVYYFLMQPELAPFLRPLDRVLALISAGIHDFKHDGVNNSFHISTASEIALRYNDHAVLENYHVAQSFLVMKNPDFNVLGKLANEDFKYAREMIIQMVLATDMAKHFEDVALFKANILPAPDEELVIKNVGDKKLLLKMILHTCDVSNPAKDREIMLKWTDRVVEEFFLQGDLEKQLQLAVSPFMDRDTIVLKKMQVGFADFIVAPLFSVWAQILSNVNAVAYKTLMGNREFWASLTDDFKPHMIKDALKELAYRKRFSQMVGNGSMPEDAAAAAPPGSMGTGRTRRSVASLLLSSEDV